MGKLIGIILIYIIGISLAGFLAAGILLALFYIKNVFPTWQRTNGNYILITCPTKNIISWFYYLCSISLFNWDVKFYTIWNIPLWICIYIISMFLLDWYSLCYSRISYKQENVVRKIKQITSITYMRQ